jgi:DNA-binding response OmpR family regulator
MSDKWAGLARILVVEDEALLQMLLIDTLEEAGFEVDSAASAADAMSKLSLIPGGVDAAIVDLGLPDRRGDVLMSEMRALYPTLPIIVMSGYDGAELRARFSRDARIAFVTKPYTPAQLLGGLKSIGVAP